MYILDTDHLSLIQRNGPEGKRIVAGLATVEAVALTVITYEDEEQIRGRLNCIGGVKQSEPQVPIVLKAV